MSTTIIDRFLKTSVGKKITREVAVQTETKRRELIERRKELLADREKRLPGQRAAVEACERKLEAARRALKTADEEHWTAARALRTDTHQTDSRVAWIGRQLKQLEPECLSAFVEQLETELEKARQSLDTEWKPTGRYAERTGKPELETWSNKETLSARQEALARDRRWAEEQACLECLTEAETLKEIERRRARWPEVKMRKVS